MQHFSPQIQVNTKKKKKKKKGLHHKWNTFFPEFKCRPALRCTPESNYWRWGYGDADQDHTQIIGRDIVELSPPFPPGFGTLILGYLRGRAAAMLRRNIHHHPELKRFLCSKTGEDRKTRFSPRNGTVFVPENR